MSDSPANGEGLSGLQAQDLLRDDVPLDLVRAGRDVHDAVRLHPAFSGESIELAGRLLAPAFARAA